MKNRKKPENVENGRKWLKSWVNGFKIVKFGYFRGPEEAENRDFGGLRRPDFSDLGGQNSCFWGKIGLFWGFLGFFAKN